MMTLWVYWFMTVSSHHTSNVGQKYELWTFCTVWPHSVRLTYTDTPTNNDHGVRLMRYFCIITKFEFEWQFSTQERYIIYPYVSWSWKYSWTWTAEDIFNVTCYFIVSMYFVASMQLQLLSGRKLIKLKGWQWLCHSNFNSRQDINLES